jgi:hypothetical protein
MAAIDFPANPTVGQRFTSGGVIWTWDGIKWTLSGSGSISINNAPPSNPLDGALWWDTVTGNLFIYYDDGTSAQWVVAVNLGTAGAQGPEGPQGPQGLTGGTFADAPTDGAAYLRSDSDWTSGGAITGSLSVGDIDIPTSPPPLYDQAYIQELTLPSGNAIRFNAYVTPEGPANIALDDGTSAIVFTDAGGLQFNVGADASAGEAVPGFGVMTLDPAGNLTAGGSGAFTGISTSGFAVGQSVIATAGSIAQATGGTFWFHSDAAQPDAFCTFLIDGAYGVNFGWNVNGHPYMGGWSAGADYYNIWTALDFANPACDYRIKDDIAPLASTWDHVKALNPIRYRQKETAAPRAPQGARPLIEADGRERWGFVAHELQETLGETAAHCNKDDPDRLQAPNLMMLVAALTKTIQEMQARIEALEARP